MNHFSTQITPIVSCIVPCFNEPPRILIGSLESLSRQTLRNFECIVVDESTNPEAIEACKNFCASDSRFIYIHPDLRLGLAESLNKGIELAKGEFIARFDSDDICRYDRLELQVNYLRKNPEISVIGSSLEIIDEAGSSLYFRSYPLKHFEIEKRFIFSSAIAHPTVMLRKSALMNYSSVYDRAFKFSEDLDLWLRLLGAGIKFANLPEALVQYRQQHTSRPKSHWKFNIKARLKNISRPYAVRKLIAVAAIAVWSYLPTRVQQCFFSIIQLRRI